MASLISIVFLLFALLLVVGLIVGIVMWASGGTKSGSGEMSCGACGYRVRGLSELNCPECGADLREAGIRPVGHPGRRTTGVVLTCCCGGLLLLGCFSTTLLFGVSSRSSSPAVNTVPVMPTQPAPVASSGTIVQNADGTKTLTNPDGSTITYYPDGSTTLVQPDGSTKHFNPDGIEIDAIPPLAEPGGNERDNTPLPPDADAETP